MSCSHFWNEGKTQFHRQARGDVNDGQLVASERGLYGSAMRTANPAYLVAC